MNPMDGIRINTQYDHSPLSKTWSDGQLDNVMYGLVYDSATSSLISEAFTLSGLEDECFQGEMVLDAVTTKYSRLPNQMKAVQRVLNRRLKPELSITDHEVGNVKKSGLYASVAAIFNVSDGQTVSIVFHAPDGDPKSIGQGDILIAFRWFLNRTDITAHVAPRNDGNSGIDLSLDQVVTKVTQLVSTNSLKFISRRENIKKQKLELEQKEAGLSETRKITAGLVQEITDTNTEILSTDKKFLSLRSKVDALVVDNNKLEVELAKLKEATQISKGDSKEPAEVKEKGYSLAKIEALKTMPILEYETAIDSVISELQDLGLLEEFEQQLEDIDKSRDADLKKLVLDGGG